METPEKVSLLIVILVVHGSQRGFTAARASVFENRCSVHDFVWATRLFKKSRLDRFVIRIAKVAQSNTDEAKAARIAVAPPSCICDGNAGDVTG